MLKQFKIIFYPIINMKIYYNKDVTESYICIKVVKLITTQIHEVFSGPSEKWKVWLQILNSLQNSFQS